jgi:hypothetical protein
MCDRIYALWYDGKILNMSHYGKGWKGKPMIYVKKAHAKAALTQVREVYAGEAGFDPSKVEIQPYAPCLPEGDQHE